MAIDRINIGTRIRKIREEVFDESREKFGRRCNLTERYIGQVERGDFLLTLSSLDKIASSIGVDVDYLLYGKNNNERSIEKQNLINLIDKSSKAEIAFYYKFLCDLRKLYK